MDRKTKVDQASIKLKACENWLDEEFVKIGSMLPCCKIQILSELTAVGATNPMVSANY
jgi:hypothetical protein